MQQRTHSRTRDVLCKSLSGRHADAPCCFYPACCAACSEPIMLSAFDFTGDDGDAFIGWGFMPNSVKALYPKGYKGMSPSGK